MQICYVKTVRENERGNKVEPKKKICEEHKVCWLFLEELKSISIMNPGLSEKKSRGRPEDGAWRWRYESTLPGNTFAGLFQCIFHMNR